MLPRRPSAVPASPPGTSPRTSSDTLSQCACKLRVSGDQPSRCCSVMSPRPRPVPTFRPTSSSSSGHSTALPRPEPAGAGTQPKTSCSRSSRHCDYAELRGQVTAPASGNTLAQPRLRHNGDISIIIQRQLRQVLVAGQPVPFVIERADDLGGGGVQQALCGVAGLQYAVRVDVGEGPLPAALGALAGLGARCGGRERVVRPV